MKEFKLDHIGREYFQTYFRNESPKNAKYKVKQKIEDLENKNLVNFNKEDLFGIIRILIHKVGFIELGIVKGMSKMKIKENTEESLESLQQQSKTADISFFTLNVGSLDEGAQKRLEHYCDFFNHILLLQRR